MINDSRSDRETTRHSSEIRQMLDDTARRAREDVHKVEDPRARALFETTAEVLLGLRKAYDDFEHNESAWR